jgi:hypothetical protein
MNRFAGFFHLPGRFSAGNPETKRHKRLMTNLRRGLSRAFAYMHLTL